MSQQLMTVDLLKVALPKNLQGNATQEFADTINQLALDPETCEEVRSNFLTYSKVLQEGKWKTQDYLSAVVYVTHKLMGYTNQDSYIRTFPDRYQALRARGATDKDISAYVAAYHKNKLVNAILEQSLIPAHLLYQDAFHAAIQTQMRLMTTANSEKVQAEAANSILTHLKAPEVKKVELDVNVKQHGGIEDLRETMAELARQQKALIEEGKASPTQMARQPVVRVLSQEEKAQAIDVTPEVRIEPVEAAAVDPAESAEAACPHNVPYRYACEICDSEKLVKELEQEGFTTVMGAEAVKAAIAQEAGVEEDESAWLEQAVNRAPKHRPAPSNPPSLFGFQPDEDEA